MQAHGISHGLTNYGDRDFSLYLRRSFIKSMGDPGDMLERPAVQLILHPIRPSQVITARSVENALRVLLALGGSTNAVIHLMAVAARLGIPVALERLNTLSDETPVLVDLKPTGNNYMEDFFAAGGMGTLLRELRPLLQLDTLTVTGETLRQRLDTERDAWVDRRVVRARTLPVSPVGGLESSKRVPCSRPTRANSRSMSPNVLRKIALREASRKAGSQSCFQFLILSRIGNMPKFIETMLHEAISGATSSAAASRWSMVMVWAPPVVMLITASVSAWMRSRNWG